VNPRSSQKSEFRKGSKGHRYQTPFGSQDTPNNIIVGADSAAPNNIIVGADSAAPNNIIVGADSAAPNNIVGAASFTNSY
jgi:hypothetical protein